MNSCYLSYASMYYALDSLDEKETNEALRDCLSDINPFLWQGIGSADPAYYSEYEQTYLANISNEDIAPSDVLPIVISYVESLDCEYSGMFPECPHFAPSFVEEFTSDKWEEIWKLTQERLVEFNRL